MVTLALKENKQYLKKQTIIIGDRLYTDIACGINTGVKTCVVYIGEAKREDIAKTEFVPIYKYNSVKEIYLDFLNETNTYQEK